MKNEFVAPSDLHAALDILLASAPREIRLYDIDLDAYGIEQPERHAALRAVSRAGGRIELLLESIASLHRDCPRLMTLLRDFGHVLEIRQADEALVLDAAFVLFDRRGVITRPDKHALRGTAQRDDAATAARLNQAFEAVWQRATVNVGATTLGL